MGLNNKKKIVSQLLTVCIFSSLIGSNTYLAIADTEINIDATNDTNINVSIQQNDNIVTEVDANTNITNEENQTSIIKKFDFEYELQVMIDTYKNMKETQKAQARLDTLDFIDQVLKSDEYSIDEKRELYRSALSNAAINQIIAMKETLEIKKNSEFELNRQVDAENLELTIEKILNSSASISSKKDFCVNSLELAKLSETITEEQYQVKLKEVEDTLAQQQKEEDERIAKEEAEKIAREEQAKKEAEELAKQQAITEKAQTATTDTTVDTSSLQDSPVQEQSNLVGFNGTLNYSEKDFLALANVVQHEVGNCSSLSKQMVASVVINRALSGIFPSSLYDVVNQTNQFTGMKNFIDRTDYATEDTIYWCQYVLDNGVDYSNGALFYYAPQWCGYMSYFENMTLVAEHDGQRYFK